MRRVAMGLGLAVVLAVGMWGCASTQQEPAAMAPSVYKQMGGREGIALVVDDFVANMAADPRVNTRFAALKPVDVLKLKSNLSDQICDATGGPCAYVGRDMKTVHKGMGITDTEWNATVEALVKALDKNNVPAGAKASLLTTLGAMKPDIVGQ